MFKARSSRALTGGTSAGLTASSTPRALWQHCDGMHVTAAHSRICADSLLCQALHSSFYENNSSPLGLEWEQTPHFTESCALLSERAAMPKPYKPQLQSTHSNYRQIGCRQVSVRTQCAQGNGSLRPWFFLLPQKLLLLLASKQSSHTALSRLYGCDWFLGTTLQALRRHH